MKSDINAKIMMDIVYRIKDTPEWVQATDKTPMLTEERKRLEDIIARVPDDLRDALEHAIASVEEAYVDMALLYGMRVDTGKTITTCTDTRRKPWRLTPATGRPTTG